MASSKQAEESGRISPTTSKDKTSAGWTLSDDRGILQKTGYELLKKIGHGSFAKVWRAKSYKYKKDVAVKIIAKPQASKEYVQKFLPRELDIIQKLKHKSLIRFYEVIETWHSVYIVMQLAERGTIADLIERKKSIPEIQSRRFYIQLMDVVEYCHLKGVVHRDIKCENLLLDRDNNLLLTDFGFAKRDVYPLSGGKFRPSKTYCGSYAYAPPEVLANKPYNPCLADVWCMGMVLYTMLYGVLPYKHQNMKALIAAKKKPPNFPEIPFVTQKAKNCMLLMLVVETERATLTALRRDHWLNFPQTSSTLRRFAWIPGLRLISLEDDIFKDKNPTTSSETDEENIVVIEDNSTTAIVSDVLGNESIVKSRYSLEEVRNLSVSLVDQGNQTDHTSE